MQELHGFGIFGRNSIRMRSFLLIFCLLIVGLHHAQSKKEQIEILNKRVDSLNEVVGSERKINLDNATKISEFTNTITNLESSISSLNANVSKLTSELQQTKTESATKTQDLAKLQAQLKTKTDSLVLILGELEKLKPAPKPVVNNNTTNQVTQTGPFKSVKIGTQIWMTENLNVSTFRNGDPIPEAKTNEEWKKAGEEGMPAWSYLYFDPNGEQCGKFYNWYAVNDSRGLAPINWHIPSSDEIDLLKSFVGKNSGEKLKGSNGWENYACKKCYEGSPEFKKICTSCKGTQKNSSNPLYGNGSNLSRFSGKPCGTRLGWGGFVFYSNNGLWWILNENYFQLSYNNDDTFIGDTMYYGGKALGCSVRCIKD